MNLEATVERAMAGCQGCLVVLDAKTGRMIACHNQRGATMRTARPGSTVKPFTLMALIEAGIVTSKSRIVCESPLRVAGRRLDCAHPADGIPLDPVMALAFSCNFYFGTMARLLDPGRLMTTFERAGLGRHPGVLRRAADQDQLQLQALGESSIEVTVAGLAEAYWKLSMRLGDYPMIRDGLLGCVEYGTGQLARRGKLQIFGKTGTATSRHGAWTHGWFVGFTPELVVAVFIEKGQGGADAAPIASQVL